MKLTLWTYEGPPHVGAMRVATAMRDVHYVLHAPQGDTYADLLFTMIERLPRRPPVTYTTFQARDLGKDTADLFKQSVQAAYERFKPAAMMVGSSCTAELIQDDPGGLAASMTLPVPIVPLELPSYQRKENWGAAETFYRMVRAMCLGKTPARRASVRPRCNLLGPTALGFRHRDDVTEISRLLDQIGIDVAIVAPLNATPADLAALIDADFNVLLYPETGQVAATWLEREFGIKYSRTVPLGVNATREFIREVCGLAGIDPPNADPESLRAGWYARSVDSTYLTGKRVYVFGDATHAIAAARIAAEEMGFTVVGLGTYSREFAREVREAAKRYGVEPLITDDYLEVEAQIAELHPELVLGTQMERHIAKRLSVPCAVISAPVHVQDFPARYAPQMGFEGANVMFDTWIHPLMMGLEEHLIHMFREDFEFHDGAAPSHLGHGAVTASPQGVAVHGTQTPVITGRAEPDVVIATAAAQPRNDDIEPADRHRERSVAVLSVQMTTAASQPPDDGLIWAPDALKELNKIPFFVRGKARRNTERFAQERSVNPITVETLYDAKAHFSR